MEIQKIAKSVSIAIDEALKELDTTIDKIEFEVLQEPSSGFLGLGRRPAIVLVKLVETDNNKEPKQEPKKEPKQEVKQEAKQEVKQEIKQEAKQEVKQEIKQDIKQELNTDLVIKSEKKPTNPNALQEATDFLTQVLSKMDIEIEIDANINDKNDLFIELKGENVGVAIGKRGQTLDSLQYLVNLVINKGDYAYTSVTIDTQQYRERRKKTLESLALNLGEKTKKLGKSFNLEPMNPFERQIIHATLQGDKLVKTYSVGEEPHRYVVISPKHTKKNSKNKNI